MLQEWNRSHGESVCVCVCVYQSREENKREEETERGGKNLSEWKHDLDRKRVPGQQQGSNKTLITLVLTSIRELTLRH